MELEEGVEGIPDKVDTIDTTYEPVQYEPVQYNNNKFISKYDIDNKYEELESEYKKRTEEKRIKDLDYKERSKKKALEEFNILLKNNVIELKENGYFQTTRFPLIYLDKNINQYFSETPNYCVFEFYNNYYVCFTNDKEKIIEQLDKKYKEDLEKKRIKIQNIIDNEHRKILDIIEKNKKSFDLSDYLIIKEENRREEYNIIRNSLYLIRSEINDDNKNLINRDLIYNGKKINYAHCEYVCYIIGTEIDIKKAEKYLNSACIIS